MTHLEPVAGDVRVAVTPLCSSPDQGQSPRIHVATTGELRQCYDASVVREVDHFAAVQRFRMASVGPASSCAGYPARRSFSSLRRLGVVLRAIETVSPAISAIGVTDYCVARSYERVKAAKDNGRLANCHLLFPNVELRLNTGTVKGNYVNIHLLVCPDDPDHVSELIGFSDDWNFRRSTTNSPVRHQNLFVSADARVVRRWMRRLRYVAGQGSLRYP